MPSGKVSEPLTVGESRHREGALGGPALVVELVGLPGAGKTTVAALAAAELEKRGLACADRTRVAAPTSGRATHFGRIGRFYLAHPVHVAGAVGLAFRSGWPLRGPRLSQALRLFAWSHRLWRARALSSDVVLLDQGPVQAAWSSMLHHGMANAEAVHQAVSRIIAGARLPYALVWMEVDPAMASERIWNRETMESSFDRLSVEQAIRLLDEQGPRLRRLYEAVSRTARTATLELDGRGPLAGKCDELCRFIESATGGVRR